MISVHLSLKHLPLVLTCFGLSDSLRFAGLKLEEVLRLFDGLDALPDVEVSVLSVLDELCELCVSMLTACSSPSLESSLESPVKGIERICEARYLSRHKIRQ